MNKQHSDQDMQAAIRFLGSLVKTDNPKLLPNDVKGRISDTVVTYFEN